MPDRLGPGQSEMASSGVVFIEPAPFDILIVVFVILFVVSRKFVIPELMYLPFMLILSFVFFNLVSAMFVLDVMVMAKFLMITVYMILLFISIFCIAYTWQNGATIVMKGYLASCAMIWSISLVSFFRQPYRYAFSLRPLNGHV